MKPNVDYLSRELLAQVSRSFYLTLRVLPSAIREPLSLAYLLARATDTIADTKSLPLSTRLANLRLFRQVLTGNKPQQETLIQIINTTLPYQDNAAEQQLLAQLEACFAWLATLDCADQQDIIQVLTTITQGQLFDIDYFQPSDELVSLQTVAELDHYTYAVAGCVGEFWTKICWRHIPRYINNENSQVQSQALAFGKGLQLINILRDLPQDLQAGRCYLPLIQLQHYKVLPQQLLQQATAVQPVLNFWFKQALDYLHQGWAYVSAIHSRRIRYALTLPILIGLHTLALLMDATYIAQHSPVKISRWQVRRLLMLASLGLVSHKIVDGYYQRLRQRVIDSCTGLLAQE